jgi:hypothetical protein
LFVGQWVPTLLIFGLYNKLVKQLGSDRTENAVETLSGSSSGEARIRPQVVGKTSSTLAAPSAGPSRLKSGL